MALSGPSAEFKNHTVYMKKNTCLVVLIFLSTAMTTTTIATQSRTFWSRGISGDLVGRDLRGVSCCYGSLLAAVVGSKGTTYIRAYLATIRTVVVSGIDNKRIYPLELTLETVLTRKSPKEGPPPLSPSDIPLWNHPTGSI
uniref:Uncharacterized protein n=1 Tax=Amphora coffeiformis TaxID=265554 RepID=A0A7S3P2X2_9STRA|eukprot:scaffold4510_cov183-Amphora_coffeaeformis.AAC.107